MLFDEFLKKVDQARAGKNKWLPFPFSRLSRHIGISDSSYYLIGGDPGTGKSAFTTYTFVMHLYNYYRSMKNNNVDKKLDFDITLFSLERSKEFIIAKWTAWLLFHKYDILTDVNTILGRTVNDHIIKEDEFYKKVKSIKPFIDELEEILDVVSVPQNPTGIYKYMVKKAELFGSLDKSNPYDPVYTYNDENKIVIFIVDHIGKLIREQGFNDRENLSKASEYFGLLRDRYDFSPVIVSQFNRSLADTTRRTKIDLAPEKSDFKGASNMYEDADVVIGLFNPQEYQLKSDLGYNITKFVNKDGYNRYRSAHVLKNYFGADNLSVGLQFIGEIGHYRELKRPTSITKQDYERYANPNKTYIK
jgi:hypothetical protein